MGVGGTVPRRVSRVQLGVLVRDYRLRAGITPRQLATEMQWHHSKVSKVETGSTTLVGLEVEKLIELLRIPDELAPRIRELGAEARRRGPLAKVPDWAQTHVDLEQGADEIKAYADELMPPLLQTEAYARAMLATSVLPENIDDIDARVRDRIRRAERLSGPKPPRLWAIVGEAALHRDVGGLAVLREQLVHLRELAGLPTVSLQILPFGYGAHAALGVTFQLLEFSDPDLTFVFLEGLTDAQYYDRPPHTDAYRAVFGKVLAAAENEPCSLAMLDRRIEELARVDTDRKQA